MNNNKKVNSNKRPDKKAGFQRKKPTYVKKQFQIAYQDFYADALDSLYNLLSEISWDKVAVPVKMSRADLLNDPAAKGSVVIGSVAKFNNDNTFTVSMSEDNANTISNKKMVMSIRCYKNNDEITYITELSLTDRFESIDERFKDIGEAFESADEDASNKVSE